MAVQLANLNSFADILAGLTQIKEAGATNYELQGAIENVYSKRNIRKMVMSDIQECEPIMHSVFTCVRFIEDWMQQDFYLSKNLEIKKLEGTDLEAMVLDIMVILMQQDFHYFEMTKVVASVLKCTPFGGVILELENDTESKAYMRGIKCACSILVKMAEADLIDIHPAYRSATGTVCVSLPFHFDGETGKAIERAKFLPPMVCKPKKLKKNTDSGYLSFNSHRITKKLQQHNGDICLDVINLVNSTPYTLNQQVLEMCHDEFSFDDEKDLDEEKQRELFEAHVKATNETCIELITLGNKFWFEWFVDYRGRMYDRGYELHIQGNSYKKAMLDFHEPSEITGWEAYASIFDFDVPSETELALAELEEKENQSNNSICNEYNIYADEEEQSLPTEDDSDEEETPVF